MKKRPKDGRRDLCSVLPDIRPTGRTGGEKNEKDGRGVQVWMDKAVRSLTHIILGNGLTGRTLNSYFPQEIVDIFRCIFLLLADEPAPPSYILLGRENAPPLSTIYSIIRRCAGIGSNIITNTPCNATARSREESH